MLQSILPALLHDLRGVLVVGSAILALLVGSELLYRIFKLPNEHTRKLSHIGSGFIVLVFPWLLSSAWSVALLTVTFLAILVGGKKTGLLQSIHGVERRTGGAFYYPVAVLGVWLLSGGEPLLFTVPIAIMAIADTGAALVGKTRGENRFPVLDGERSFEGSATFFGLALAIVLGGLALAQRPGWPDMLLVALVTALLTCAVEAVSVRGSDNLFIPYAAWLVMERTLRLGLEELSAWVLGMLLALGVVVASLRLTRMQPAGALLTFVMGSLAFAMGGWAWLLPMLALYGLYALLRPRGAPTDLQQIFPSTAGSLLVVLIYAHSDDPTLYGPYLVTICANAAIAPWLTLQRRGLALALALPAACAPVLAVLPLGGPVPLAGAVLGGLGGLALFLALDRTPLRGRRPVAAVSLALLAWLFFSQLG